jgi:FMN phosphatase YigB (HAD superfamily)
MTTNRKKMQLPEIIKEQEAQYAKEKLKHIIKPDNGRKIKHIIFDIDNVLIDLGDLCYKAYINAVSKFIGAEFTPTKSEYNKNYKHLPISLQIDKLCETYNRKITTIEKVRHDLVNDYKNEILSFSENLEYNKELMDLLEKLRDNFGLSFSIISNHPYEFVRSIRDNYLSTIYVGLFYSYEHARLPKPDFDMYLKTLWVRMVMPKEVLCIESNQESYKTALSCSMNAVMVKNSKELKYENLSVLISRLNS